MSRLSHCFLFVLLVCGFYVPKFAAADIFNVFAKSGQAMQVTASNTVVQSATTSGATNFFLVPCLAQKNGKIHHGSCVSLTPVDQPGSYVRHYNWHLFVEPEKGGRNPTIFDVDASYILRRDLFYPGTIAFQSVNAPDRFIVRTDDDRYMVLPRAETTQYREWASFVIKEFQPLRQ